MVPELFATLVVYVSYEIMMFHEFFKSMLFKYLPNLTRVDFAKLTRKRALSAMQQHQPTQAQVHKMQMAQLTRNTQVLPSIVTQPKPTMGIIGGMHLGPPLQSTQMMQSPNKRPRMDIPINHPMNGPSNGNYLKA